MIQSFADALSLGGAQRFLGMKRLLRTFLLVAFTLMVWTVSTRASAASPVPGPWGMAGLCGEDGSTQVAPPPLLMPAHASLEQGDFDMCVDEWTGDAAQRGEDRNELTRSMTAEAVIPTTLAVPTAAHTEVTTLADVDVARAGVRFGLERPPR